MQYRAAAEVRTFRFDRSSIHEWVGGCISTPPPHTARPDPPPTVRPASFSTAAPSQQTGPSLRDQFFAACEYELGQRFPDAGEITRVLRFVQSCKAGGIPPEAPTNLPFYQPSEEYVAGLSARPWPDPHSFPWVKPLEEASPSIQEELARVLAEQRQEDFKGDSNVQKVMGTGWTALRLQRFGIWNEDVCARFPHTVKVRVILGRSLVGGLCGVDWIIGHLV